MAEAVAIQRYTPEEIISADWEEPDPPHTSEETMDWYVRDRRTYVRYYIYICDQIVLRVSNSPFTELAEIKILEKYAKHHLEDISAWEERLQKLKESDKAAKMSEKADRVAATNHSFRQYLRGLFLPKIEESVSPGKMPRRDLVLGAGESPPALQILPAKSLTEVIKRRIKFALLYQRLLYSLDHELQEFDQFCKKHLKAVEQPDMYHIKIKFEGVFWNDSKTNKQVCHRTYVPKVVSDAFDEIEKKSADCFDRAIYVHCALGEFQDEIFKIEEPLPKKFRMRKKNLLNRMKSLSHSHVWKIITNPSEFSFVHHEDEDDGEENDTEHSVVTETMEEA